MMHAVMCVYRVSLAAHTHTATDLLFVWMGWRRQLQVETDLVSGRVQILCAPTRIRTCSHLCICQRPCGTCLHVTQGHNVLVEDGVHDTPKCLEHLVLARSNGTHWHHDTQLLASSRDITAYRRPPTAHGARTHKRWQPTIIRSEPARGGVVAQNQRPQRRTHVWCCHTQPRCITATPAQHANSSRSHGSCVARQCNCWRAAMCGAEQ